MNDDDVVVTRKAAENLTSEQGRDMNTSTLSWLRRLTTWRRPSSGMHWSSLKSGLVSTPSTQRYSHDSPPSH